MWGVGGTYAGHGDSPGRKRGDAAANEEEPAIPRDGAMDLVARRLDEEPSDHELPSPCTGRTSGALRWAGFAACHTLILKNYNYCLSIASRIRCVVAVNT